MESNTLAREVPEQPQPVDSATTRDMAHQARYLDSLLRGLTQAQAEHHNGYPPLHDWRKDDLDFVRLEAAARTWGRLQGARKLADRVLDGSALHTVLATLDIAHDRAGQITPDRLTALKALGRWQGLEPQRAGSMVQVNVQASLEPPPRTVLVEQSITPKDQQSTDQDTAGL